MENPQGSETAMPRNIDNSFLDKFKIIDQHKPNNFSGSIIEFTMYSSENGCKNNYIGIPFGKDLKVDYFDNIKEIYE